MIALTFGDHRPERRRRNACERIGQFVVGERRLERVDGGFDMAELQMDRPFVSLAG